MRLELLPQLSSLLDLQVDRRAQRRPFLVGICSYRRCICLVVQLDSLDLLVCRRVGHPSCPLDICNRRLSIYPTEGRFLHTPHIPLAGNCRLRCSPGFSRCVRRRHYFATCFARSIGDATGSGGCLRNCRFLHPYF